MSGCHQFGLIDGVDDKTDDNVIVLASGHEQHVYNSPAADPRSVAIESPSILRFSRSQTRRPGKETAECDAALQLSTYGERQPLANLFRSCGIKESGQQPEMLDPDKGRRKAGRCELFDNVRQRADFQFKTIN